MPGGEHSAQLFQKARTALGNDLLDDLLDALPYSLDLPEPSLLGQLGHALRVLFHDARHVLEGAGLEGILPGELAEHRDVTQDCGDPSIIHSR